MTECSRESRETIWRKAKRRTKGNVIDQNDTRQALDQVVAELRLLSYAELRERVTVDWPWIMRKGLAPGAARGVWRLWDRLRGRPQERLIFVDGCEPARFQVNGPKGTPYDVLVDFSWANREEDVEVTAWINDEESEAEQVEVVEIFVVPAHRPRPTRRP
jgi:hypothetical protein